MKIFRVLVPPEIIEIAKKIALLPRDAARVINGLLHLPLDTMRAIAVLDAPVQTIGEVITYEEQQEMTMEEGSEEGNEEVTEVSNVPAPTPAPAQTPAQGGNDTTATTPEQLAPPPKGPVPEIPPELSEEHNISTVMEEGKEFFIEQVNATGGIIKETFTDPVLMSGGENASAYKGLMDYGMDTIKRFQNLTESLGTQASYKTYADAYNKSVIG